MIDVTKQERMALDADDDVRFILDEDGGFRVHVSVYETAMRDPRNKLAVAILRRLAQSKEPTNG